MYSKLQASKLREKFWTTFGQYMKPVRSAEGYQVNWINYKTGLKDVYFKMKTFRRSAQVGIYLTHPEPEIQSLFFEQFKLNKKFLESIVGEEWNWELNVSDENERIISRIFVEKNNVSVLNTEDWPQLITFFKPRIMALDEFWSMAKVSFDPLK